MSKSSRNQRNQQGQQQGNRGANGSNGTGINQQTQKQIEAAMKVEVARQLAAMATADPATRFDAKSGVFTQTHKVNGIIVTSITGLSGSVLKTVLDNWQDGMQQIIAIGLRTYTEEAYLHVVIADNAFNQDIPAIAQAVDKAFTNGTFDERYAYLNEVAAMGPGLYVVNGQANLGQVNNLSQMLNALAKTIFGENHLVRGATTNAVVFYAPENQRQTYVVAQGQAVQLPQPQAGKGAKVAFNVLGTTALIAVERGTNSVFLLTRSQVYQALAGQADIAWSKQTIQTEAKFEDVSLCVENNGIDTPCVAFTLGNGNKSALIFAQILVDGEEITFDLLPESAIVASSQTEGAMFQRIGTAGVTAITRNGEETAISHMAIEALGGWLQKMNQAVAKAQQGGSGGDATVINSLQTAALPFHAQLGGAVTARRTGQPTTAVNAPPLS